MRLFLSSQDLGNYPKVFAKLVGTNKKVAYIKNAQDDSSESERSLGLTEKKQMFNKLGLEFEELDLRKYFGRLSQLEAKLSEFGAVWCAGGNTFILRRAMKSSGFDELIIKRLNEDSIVYGGSSAGSCVTAPSLDGIQHGDRPGPDSVPVNYPDKATIWEGLNLVPFMVVPHCDSDWFKEEAENSIKHLQAYNISFKPLKDGQVIVINGNKEELLP